MQLDLNDEYNMHSQKIFPFALAIASVVSAPAPAEEIADVDRAACISEAPADLLPLWSKVCDTPRNSRSLALMYGGLAAFKSGHQNTAERAFDQVLQNIETIYADNPNAEKARSAWNAESVKDFKGEPFERMMAYYYRGLLYLGKGDWGNAQASFQGGILQDTMAGEKRFRADNASLIWLQGWSEKCRGAADRAALLFTEAETINPSLKPPNPEQHTLIIAEPGQGPQKFQWGRYGEKLGVAEGMAGNYGLGGRLGGAPFTMTKAEDLFFQAATRGGRPADDILAQKASDKDNLLSVGRGATAAGLGIAGYSALHQSNGNQNNNNAAAAGLAVALIGLMIEAAAENMNPGSDSRTWGTLPHSLYIAPSAAPPDAPLILTDPAGRNVLADADAVSRRNAGACALVWVGGGSITPSLAVQTADSGQSAPGNCRTSSGELAMLAPDVCSRIGGAPLTASSNTPAASAGLASKLYSTSCRTTTKDLVELNSDACRKIGGSPQ
jgi:hypothetical protein